jgi:hypothetical protein
VFLQLSNRFLNLRTVNLTSGILKNSRYCQNLSMTV